MTHCYRNGIDEIYFSDDLPKFGYIAHDHFLAVWEILSGLSWTEIDEDIDAMNEGLNAFGVLLLQFASKANIVLLQLSASQLRRIMSAFRS